ncbi:hypothetical protein VDGL01_02246 [Verticillium dahliae]
MSAYSVSLSPTTSDSVLYAMPPSFYLHVTLLISGSKRVAY